jgi:hypothetical protein
VIDMRLQERGENWRLAYKSLLLMEYMAKHGPLVSVGVVNLLARAGGRAAAPRQRRPVLRELRELRTHAQHTTNTQQTH